MNEPRKNLSAYFASLRTADPIEFEQARRVVSAASMLERSSIIDSVRLDFLIWSKRSLDLLITPLLGLLIVALVPSATMVPRSSLANLVSGDQARSAAGLEREILTPSKLSKGFSQRASCTKLTDRTTAAAIRASASPIGSVSNVLDVQANPHSSVTETVISRIPEVVVSNSLASVIGAPLSPFELNAGALKSPTGFTVYASTSVAGTIRIPTIGSYSMRENALGGELALSSEHAIGFVVGVQSYSERVVYQSLVQTGDPTTGAIQTHMESIEGMRSARNIWYGVDYSWTPAAARVFYFQPMLQVAVGMSSLGAMLRGALGLEWHPTDAIAIGASATNSLFTGSSSSNGQVSATCILISGGVNW